MLNQFFSSNLSAVLLAIISIQGILLLIFIGALIRMSGITRKFKLLINNTTQDNLEKLLLKALELGEQNNGTIKLVEERQTEIRTTLSKCLQNRAVIRFNAFDDLGGELSFALAFLDANGDGVVISSLYGRQECRAYAKPIVQGKSKHPLSEEELKAIKDALQLRSSRQ